MRTYRISINLLFLLSILFGACLGYVSYAYPQPVSSTFELESFNAPDEKEKAKNLILFLTKIGAPASTIEEKLSQFNQTKVTEAITELKAENKIKDKSNSEVISK